MNETDPTDIPPAIADLIREVIDSAEAKRGVDTIRRELRLGYMRRELERAREP